MPQGARFKHISFVALGVSPLLAVSNQSERLTMLNYLRCRHEEAVLMASCIGFFALILEARLTQNLFLLRRLRTSLVTQTLYNYARRLAVESTRP